MTMPRLLAQFSQIITYSVPMPFARLRAYRRYPPWSDSLYRSLALPSGYATDQLNSGSHGQRHRSVAKDSGSDDHGGDGRRHGVVKAYKGPSTAAAKQHVITESGQHDNFGCERITTRGGGDEAAVRCQFARCHFEPHYCVSLYRILATSAGVNREGSYSISTVFSPWNLTPFRPLVE